MLPSLRPGWDVLVIARPAIVGAEHRAIVEALRRLLARGGVVSEASVDQDMRRA
jgi:RNase P protein component